MHFSILALLGVLFVALKLTSVIAWSWWLVTLPFWGPPVILGTIFVVGAIAVVMRL